MVTTSPVVPGPPEPSTVEPGPQSRPARPLDIVFLQDSTGSQGSYIKSAREAISMICTKVTESAALSQGAIRFGLIAFRDHPPQDSSYVTKNFGFTKDPEVMKKNLGSLIASGGGDGPEASTAALAEALNLDYAEDAVKIVVLITDAPPHGIGETGDGFPNGSPDQNDPLQIARQMAEHGITLYVIACEPSLSNYAHAVDFYRALTQITSGRIVPLTNAQQLGDFIVGSAIETLETEHLIGQFEKVILEDVYGQGKSIEEVMQNVQDELNKKNIMTTQMVIDDIYKPCAIAEKNTDVWRGAASLASARPQVQRVSGARLKDSHATAPPTPPTSSSMFSFGARATRRSAPMPPPPGGAAKESAYYGMAPSAAMSAGAAAGESASYGLETPVPMPAPSRRTGITLSMRGMRAPTALSSAPQAMAPSPAPMMAMACPPPQAPQQQQQLAASYAPQQADRSQARRMVMQNLMRNAKVGPGGVLQPKGVWADKGPLSIDESVYGSGSGPS